MAEVVKFPKKPVKRRPGASRPMSMGDDTEAPVSDELSARIDEENRRFVERYIRGRTRRARVSFAAWAIIAGFLGWWWLCGAFALMFLFARPLVKWEAKE